MMNGISITQLIEDTRADFVYEVELIDGRKYTVRFSQAYYQKLTKGEVDSQELVRKSFEFLLEREGPESILPEFALPDIQRYFPEYEGAIGRNS